MQDIFSMDLENYNPDGKVMTRPSVRAIISLNDEILLIYSQKYHYYKFPGGGIEKNENHQEALIREVQEESGYQIIPESIEEYGRVLRRQKDSYDENAIFEQENFYYFAEVKAETTTHNLDAYEAEEGFTPVWMNAMVASRINLYGDRIEGADDIMIQREGKVLEIADLIIRKRERKKRQDAFIKSLGNLDYRDMITFVHDKLTALDTETMGSKSSIHYSRFDHTLRVLNWAKRLYDASDIQNELRYEDLIIATIFHDVGRAKAKELQISHALAGVPITKEYLLAHGFDEERTAYICSLVARHSDKDVMQEPSTDPNLVLLMEADILDDMGALGIVMDCMIVEKRDSASRFEDCLDHILRYTARIQKDNPMVTPAGIRFWEEKTNLVNSFTKALKADLEW